MMKLFFLFVFTICKISSALELTNNRDISDVGQRIRDCVRRANSLTGGSESICLESYIHILELSLKIETLETSFKNLTMELVTEKKEQMKITNTTQQKIEAVLDKLELIENVTKADQEEHTRKLAVECTPPFEVIGDRCIFVDNNSSGTWTEMRSLCESLGGDMIKLDEAELLYDIVQYIKERGMTEAKYWIGATDEGHEGQWTWTDGSCVRLGTPFWAYWETDHTQAPYDGYSDSQHCALLDGKARYFFNDRSCSSKWNIICQASVVLSN